MKRTKIFFLLVIGLGLLLPSIIFAETITIDYVTLGGVQMEIMGEMISQFEKENPEIKVKVEDWPFEDASSKYVTRIKAGDPPDCGYIFVTDLDEFKERGALVPIEDYLPTSMKEDYYEVLLDRNTLEDGKIWAIPAWFSTRLYMYRKDVLDEYGLKIPETEEELLNVARTLHNPPEMYGFPFPGKSPRHIFRWFGTQLWGRGGDFFTPDMKRVIFNSEAGVEALTFLNELKVYFEPGFLQDDEHDVERLFYMGKVPVVQMYYRVLTNAMNDNPSWEVVTGYVPTPNKVALGIMDSFAIFKTTPERQAASWKWLEFIATNEYRVKSNLELGFQPVRKSEAEEFMKSDEIRKYPAIKDFIDATQYSRFEPIHPMWNQIQDILGRAIQECFLGKVTPQQALDEAATKANKILDEYNK